MNVRTCVPSTSDTAPLFGHRNLCRYIDGSVFSFLGATALQWVMAPSFTRFLDHTQQCTEVGGTSLDEWSARSRDLYLTTHNTHNRHTSIPSDGIQTLHLRRRAAAELCLGPSGHRDRIDSRGKWKYCRQGGAIPRGGILGWFLFSQDSHNEHLLFL